MAELTRIVNPSVIQSGKVTPEHLAVWVTDGVLADAGVVSGFAPVLPPNPWVTPQAFGAVADGVHDDTAAITAAILSLGGAGNVWFQPGNYLITSTISILEGVHLYGVGGPSFAGTVVTWGGANGGLALGVDGGTGDFNNWGIHNLTFSGNGNFTALRVMSASHGICENIYFSTVLIGMNLGCNPGGENTSYNIFRNIHVFADVANARGMIIDGGINVGAADPCFNVFEDITVVFGTTGTSTGMRAIYLGWTDTNLFDMIEIHGGIGDTVGVYYDYSGSAEVPSCNLFLQYSIEPAIPFFNNGALPVTGVALQRFYGLNDGNGDMYPALDGTAHPAEVVSSGLNLVNQSNPTQSGVFSQLGPYYTQQGQWRVSLYATTRTADAAATAQVRFNVIWTDDTGNSFTDNNWIDLDVTTTNFYVSGELIIRLAGTNPGGFGWSIVPIGGSIGNARFDVHYRIERLQ